MASASNRGEAIKILKRRQKFLEDKTEKFSYDKAEISAIARAIKALEREIPNEKTIKSMQKEITTYSGLLALLSNCIQSPVLDTSRLRELAKSADSVMQKYETEKQDKTLLVNMEW